MNEYHTKQYHTEYESTQRFFDFLELGLKLSKFGPPKSILDIGCGAGANTSRLAQKFIGSDICGIDIDSELIEYANKINGGLYPNLEFKSGDLLESDIDGYEGITLIQTLSWIPSQDIYLPFESVLQKNPKWVAFSSLGYEGKAQATINILDFSEEKSWSTPYNILSNHMIREKAHVHGYEEVLIERYVPKKSISTQSNGMGSFTRMVDSEELIIFSGPLYLPWYFYFYKRK